MPVTQGYRGAGIQGYKEKGVRIHKCSDPTYRLCIQDQVTGISHKSISELFKDRSVALPLLIKCQRMNIHGTSELLSQRGSTSSSSKLTTFSPLVVLNTLMFHMEIKIVTVGSGFLGSSTPLDHQSLSPLFQATC